MNFILDRSKIPFTLSTKILSDELSIIVSLMLTNERFSINTSEFFAESFFIMHSLIFTEKSPIESKYMIFPFSSAKLSLKLQFENVLL